MLPLLLTVAAWVFIGLDGDRAWAAGRLVSSQRAQHLGLQRAWFAQVRLDRARNHIERAVLAGDRLDVLTSAGVVQEFDANTGETLWIAPIGNPNYPSLGPAVSDKFVALLNGSTLYVLDRADGRPVKVRRVGGAPGAAPALAAAHVFVPLVSGRIEGYPLGEKVLTPWYYQSIGRAMVAPLANKEIVAWGTDSGYVYVAGAAELGMRSRLETGSEIVAPPAYRKPYIYVAALSGELFAIDETSGAKRWKYATGYPVVRAPAVIGDRVFITTDEPALHCVDAKSGVAVWEAPNVAQFAAASRHRVYGVDEFGAFLVLDAATGSLIARISTEGTTNALVNDQTDRIFLVSDDGAVQCLHEIGAKQPLYHNPPAAEADSAGTDVDDESTMPTTPAAVQPQPGAEAAAPADEGDPFGEDPTEGAEETPAAEQPAPAEDDFGVEDDPFD
jgi:outer membrane protein assembly factor BamB